MLRFFDRCGSLLSGDGAAVPAEAAWIDALRPTSEEAAAIDKAFGLSLPSFEALVEIEQSSRLRRSQEALFMSLPAARRDPSGIAVTTPVGFVLARERLVTIRFEDIPVFDTIAERLAGNDGERGGPTAFVAVMEEMIDRLADILEHVGHELDDVSKTIFALGARADRRGRPKVSSLRLRAIVGRIGRSGDLTGKISDGVLGAARMIPYVESNTEGWLSASVKARLESLRHDIASLNDYETRLTDKTQFLLDATLGLVNVEQNDTFRVLTVVSVVGIPPTFFASLYGMNFKFMPEYDWHYGYAYGLCVIAASAVLPALWFKLRGWW